MRRKRFPKANSKQFSGLLFYTARVEDHESGKAAPDCHTVLILKRHALAEAAEKYGKGRWSVKQRRWGNNG